MEKVSQALVMAGGFGRRISPSLNPLHCKSLMTYNGLAMIDILFDNLLEGGISNFVVATNAHSHDYVSEIVRKKGLKKFSLVISEGNFDGKAHFRAIPYDVKDFLEDRFLMVCGHHPISADHAHKMIESSETNENVFTGYENMLYNIHKKKIILFENGKFEYIDLANKLFDENYVYVRNPYVLKKEILEIMHNDGYKHSLSYYPFIEWKKLGQSLGVVMANMPPEFDYDSDYFQTKDFLDKNPQQEK